MQFTREVETEFQVVYAIELDLRVPSQNIQIALSFHEGKNFLDQCIAMINLEISFCPGIFLMVSDNQ